MTTEWTRRTQAATREQARRNREGWTSADLELVTASAGEVTDAELAFATGRTLFAVQTIKHAVAAGRSVGSTRRPTPAYRGWREGDGDGEGL